MIREILTYPNDKEVLTLKSEEIKDFNCEETKLLIEDLKDTLNNSTGVGISAIQIGIPKRVCIIKHNGKETVIINPTITKTRGEISSDEGCLSAPNTYTKTTRFQKIWFDYYNENGERKTADEGGLFSIIAQHEFDHFNGECVVFNEVDKINEKSK